MALVLADRVRDTTTTTGTGTVTLSGTAPTGYQTFATAIGNANTTYYTINAGFQWEVGIGTFTTSGNTLSRTTVLSSSSGGALVDFAAGTKDVFVTYPAEKSVNYDGSDNVGIGTTSPGAKLDVVGKIKGVANAAFADTTAYGFRFSTSTNADRVLWGGYDNALNAGFIQATEVGVQHTNLILNPNGGNLLVGTTTADNKLTVSASSSGAAAGVLSLVNPNDGVGTAADLDFVIHSSATLATGRIRGLAAGADNYPMSFWTYGSGGIAERMRINNAGQLLVSTTTTPGSPNARIVAGGTTDAGIQLASTSGGGALILAPNGAGTTFYTYTGAVGSESYTERMRIDSSGNVGIGTSAPQGPLHVYRAGGSSVRIDTDVNASSTQLNFATTGVNKWSLYRPGGSNDLRMFDNANVIDVMTWQAGGNVGIGTSAPTRRLSISGGDVELNANVLYLNSGNAYIQGNSTNILFSTNANERMRIDGSGYLLVGATSSVGVGAVRTQIGSAASVASGFLVKSTTASISLYASSGTGSYQSWPTGGFMAFGAGPTDGSTFAEAMRIDGSGNVGIGATVPKAALNISRNTSTASVAASASIVLSNRNTTLNGGIAGGIFIDTYRDVADPHYSGGIWFTRVSQVSNFSSSSDIVFGAVNTVDVNLLPAERMRISGFSGNVGIGTSAPFKRLHVVGAIADTALFGNIGGTGTESIGGITLGSITDVPDRRAWGIKTESTNSGQLGIFCAASNSTGPFDGTQFVSINPSGYVGISVTSPVYQLQLSVDSAAKPGTNTWTIASDSRIKTETGEYTKGLDAVCALRPITYHYNGVAGFVDDGKENISIIAQEAIQHFPECVGTFEALLNEGDEEKTELFNWNGHALTFALVNAVKELKAVNDALTARVAQLEGNQP